MWTQTQIKILFCVKSASLSFIFKMLVRKSLGGRRSWLITSTTMDRSSSLVSMLLTSLTTNTNVSFAKRQGMNTTSWLIIWFLPMLKLLLESLENLIWPNLRWQWDRVYVAYVSRRTTILITYLSMIWKFSAKLVSSKSAIRKLSANVVIVSQSTVHDSSTTLLRNIPISSTS